MADDALRSELIERVHANHCTVAGCLATTEAEQDVDTVLAVLSARGLLVAPVGEEGHNSDEQAERCGCGGALRYDSDGYRVCQNCGRGVLNG